MIYIYIYIYYIHVFSDVRGNLAPFKKYPSHKGKQMPQYPYKYGISMCTAYICIPRAPMTSIFEGQSLKTRGHLGSRYIIFIYIYNIYRVINLTKVGFPPFKKMHGRFVSLKPS